MADQPHADAGDANAWARPCTYTDASGETHENIQKIWRRGRELRWEVRRIFPALGYADHSRGTKLALQWRDQEKSFKNEADTYGIDVKQICGKSHNTSAVWPRVAPPVDPSLDDEYWVNTKGLFSPLAIMV